MPILANGIWSSSMPTRLLEKVRLIAEVGRCLVNQVGQPRCGICVALDVEIGVANHVHQDEAFTLLRRPILLPLLRQVLRAVDAVASVHFTKASSPSVHTSQTL